VSCMAPLSSMVRIDAGGRTLEGDLNMPEGAQGLVLFAHGSGSSRLSPRNRQVAAILNERGLGTVLFDLLTDAEAADRRLVFDVELLATRLTAATDWIREEAELGMLPRGYFGASTGAAAALIAAADRPDDVDAVVSRGGRPDLAAPRLVEVRSPTLLIVGGADVEVLQLNRGALGALQAPAELAVVPGATHLFEERGALEQVAELSARWFARWLRRGPEAHGEAPGGAS
jgi:putative phosphoribosyl transferase